MRCRFLGTAGQLMGEAQEVRAGGQGVDGPAQSLRQVSVVGPSLGLQEKECPTVHQTLVTSVPLCPSRQYWCLLVLQMRKLKHEGGDEEMDFEFSSTRKSGPASKPSSKPCL